jgi:hypothetical protein
MEVNAVHLKPRLPEPLGPERHFLALCADSLVVSSAYGCWVET